MVEVKDSKRIAEIEEKLDLTQKNIEAEDKLGCGFTSVEFQERMYQRMVELEEELAAAKGYECYEQMLEAEATEDESFPF